MFFGFLTVMSAPIIAIVAKVFASIAYGLLHYELFIINIFANMPFSMIKIGGVGPFLLLISYIIIFIIWYLYKVDDKEKEGGIL
jgi:hypothetical protein